MVKMNKDEILEMLQNSWSQDSSLNPEGWTQESPTIGQCSATSLVVQDLLGGDIFKCDVETPVGNGVHYLNNVDEELLDYTKDQFNSFVKLNNYSLSSREEILSNAEARRAYFSLKSKINIFP